MSNYRSCLFFEPLHVAAGGLECIAVAAAIALCLDADFLLLGHLRLQFL